MFVRVTPKNGGLEIQALSGLNAGRIIGHAEGVRLANAKLHLLHYTGYLAAVHGAVLQEGLRPDPELSSSRIFTAAWKECHHSAVFDLSTASWRDAEHHFVLSGLTLRYINVMGSQVYYTSRSDWRRDEHYGRHRHTKPESIDAALPYYQPSVIQRVMRGVRSFLGV